MRIMFGSPEAAAIIAKDKDLQRLEGDDLPKGNANDLAERLERIEFEIEDLEMELAGLEDEATAIREKLKELGSPDKKLGVLALRSWNEWAKGKGKGITVQAHQQAEMDKLHERMRNAYP